MNPSQIKVAILALPETSASVIYGMYDLFIGAGRDWGFIIDGKAGPQLMSTQIASSYAGTFAAGNNVQITPQVTLKECRNADIICVPELLVPPNDSMDGRFAEEIGWLQECYANGTTIATACSGAMLLAYAGLLNGNEATTHWAYCDVLKNRFPEVKVLPQRALVTSGEGHRLVMAGGGTSWLDLTLYLVARFTSVDTAMHLARINLIDWHHIGQQPFARLARSRQVEDAVIARCQTWIAENYANPAPVNAMIQLSGLAERSFKRRFQQATGMSPLEYVHTLRLEEAKHLLESGSQPSEAIANEVGYEDAGFFTRLFKRNVNLTPAEYRKRFGAMRKALASPDALR
jgi:transcriptional regulator GlxA family with amidase domain